MAQKERDRISREKLRDNLILDYFLPAKATERQMKRAEELERQGMRFRNALEQAQQELPQTPEDVLRAAADYIIANTGDGRHLRAAAQAVLERLLAKETNGTKEKT